MRVTLKRQIFLLIIGSGLVTFLGVTGLLFYLYVSGNQLLWKASESEQELHDQQIIRDAYGLCHNVDTLLRYQIQNCFKLIHQLSGIEPTHPTTSGRLIPEPQNWMIANQFCVDQLPTPIQLTKLQVGNIGFSSTPQPTETASLVDTLYAVTGATVSIFQRINKQGDMLRVSSRLRTETSKRAVGLYMPAIHPDGVVNPIINQIMLGKSYHGRSFVLDGWYTYIYKPILDAQNQVIGMIFVGFDNSFLETLRNSLMNLDRAEQGLLWIMYLGQYEGDIGIGDTFTGGHSEVHKNIYNNEDEQGNFFIQDICSQARKLAPYQVGSKTVVIKKMQNNLHQELHYAYFKEWNWVIGIQASTEAQQSQIVPFWIQWRDRVTKTWLIQFIGTLVIAAGLCWLGHKIFGNMEKIWNLLTELAKNEKPTQFRQNKEDNTSAAPFFWLQSEEVQLCQNRIEEIARRIHRLYTQLEHTQYHLKSLIGQFVESQEQQGSLSQKIQAHQSQMLTQATQILQTSKNLKILGENLSELTPGGHTSKTQSKRLAEVEILIQSIAKTAQEMYHKLQNIADKVTKIGSMVQIINKVSDKTNLLSFNAAIEAHKAKERGLGLSVIAEEIRQFSEQAAIVNIDIQHSSQEMEQNIRSTLQDMETFIQEIHNGSQQLKAIEIRQDLALNQLQGLRSRFENITQESRLQAHYAGQLMQMTQECKEQEADKLQLNDSINLAISKVKNEVFD